MPRRPITPGGATSKELGTVVVFGVEALFACAGVWVGRGGSEGKTAEEAVKETCEKAVKKAVKKGSEEGKKAVKKARRQ